MVWEREKKFFESLRRLAFLLVSKPKPSKWWEADAAAMQVLSLPAAENFEGKSRRDEYGAEVAGK